MRIIGSRTNGTNNADSDLDILVEYEGDISEDSFFNAVNDEEGALYIDGIRVDINPITKDKSGSIEQWMNRNKGYSKAEGDAPGQSGVDHSLSQEEAQVLITEMEANAEVAPEIELTIENWDSLFGEDGIVETPIGEVKMGENQFTKLMRQGRDGKLGMVKPTLENPDVIIEDESKAKNGETERPSSYVFVKSFKKADGSRYYYFTSVTVSKDGKEVIVSNQEKRRNAIANLLTNGKLVWKHADNVSNASDVANGLYSSQGDLSDLAAEGTDAPQTNVGVNEVYNRHTTAKQPTENVEVSQDAEREGGQSLILSPNDGSAAALSALPLGLSSASEDRNSVSNSQENAEKSGEIAENEGETNEEQRGKSKEESEIAPEIQEPRSVEEDLDNGDKRITNYNSRGEVATVAIERDGKVVSVDSYDEGVLFEHTEYDGNGKATSVTRYDKQGNVVGTQVYEDGKAKTPMQKLADRILDRTEEKRRIPLRERARELEAQVGVKANIIESLDEVKNREARKRIAAGEAVAGWYSGGQVYLYMPNIKDKREIELTYVHEVVAHHGVKKLLGERFNEFLDGVWNMMSEADRERMLAYVGANENPTLQDMRAAADEYVAELAEKMNLGELEQSTWEKIVGWFKKILENIGFENLTREDIESMLKASYSNLKAESGKGKTGSEEIKDRTMFRVSRTPQEFDATQAEAVEKRGIVTPGLNEVVVNVVDVPRHDFTGRGRDAIHKAEKWANENIAKEHTYHEGQEDEFKYTIDEDAISKFLSSSSTGNSENLGVHLAALKELPNIINNSIDVEVHPDYQKKDGARSAENGVGRNDLLVHRMYGAVSIDGKVYRAKTTIHELRDKENKAYDYKITEIELIVSGSSTSNARTNSTSVSGAKLLEGVEKSYDKGKKVLDESENSSENPQDAESSVRFRKVEGRDRYDWDGNLIGDGSWHVPYEINDIALSYPNITYKVHESASTESVYVTYYNNDPKYSESERPKVTVRFSNHTSNAVAYGDQLVGLVGVSETAKKYSTNLLLVKLGLKKEVPVRRKLIDSRAVSNKVLNSGVYEEADKTIQELYDLPVGADISQYKGKLAKGSRYLILGDKVKEGEIVGHKFEDIPEVEKLRAKQMVRELIVPFAKELREMQESVMEGQTMFRFIGKKGAANLDNAEEATTRLDNLAVAREMETAGKEAKAIKLATGWERGADGKWRYETEDYTLNQDAKVYDVYNGVERPFSDFFVMDGARGFIDTDYSLRLDELINDKELFTAYPELEQFFVSVERLASGTMGELNFDNKVIRLGRERVHLVPNVINGKRSYKVEVGSVLAHEIQHAIQHIEGFAKGGNTETIDVIQDKARVWAWRNALKETEKEHPELAGTTELEKVLMDEYRTEGLEEYIPAGEQRIKGFNLYARGYDGEGYERAFYAMPNVVAGNGFATYRRLAGEVESRNVQNRMGLTPEERRESLAEETEDVARKDQIFIYDALESAMMGSRVDARMAEVAAHFEGKQLTAEQQAVADVFGGKADNLTISVKTKEGNERKVVMRQGNEMGAGAKHSLFRHFGMNNGAITADDILLIPEILSNGERVEKKRGKKTVIEYKYTDNNGVEYTVLTEIDSRREAFANFYTNRKASSAARKTRSEEARDIADDASEDKGSDNSSNTQEGEARFRTIAEVERIDSESVKAIESLSQELNTPAEVVTDIESIADERKKRDAKKGMKGWFDPKTGKVVVVLPNVSDTQDAVETMLHEAVGHRGLRALFGKRYNDFLNQVFAYGSLFYANDDSFHQQIHS